MLGRGMLFLRRLHLYLGCLFAPALLFFAISGAWQLYRFHDSKKDGSYTAPRAVEALSAVHMNSHLPGNARQNIRPCGPSRYWPRLAWSSPPRSAS